MSGNSACPVTTMSCPDVVLGGACAAEPSALVTPLLAEIGPAVPASSAATANLRRFRLLRKTQLCIYQPPQKRPRRVPRYPVRLKAGQGVTRGSGPLVK